MQHGVTNTSPGQRNRVVCNRKSSRFFIHSALETLVYLDGVQFKKSPSVKSEAPLIEQRSRAKSISGS